jgi:hypothetical protein
VLDVLLFHVMHDQVMPPRDLYDINPVYSYAFFSAYCDLLVGHPILEIDPLQLIEVSMLTEGEFREIFQMDEDPDTEVEELHDGSTDDDDSDSDDDMSDGEAEWVIQNQEWVNHNTYGGSLYMDVMRAMGWSLDNYPGAGTQDDPIDMTDA